MNNTAFADATDTRLIHTIKITWQHGTQWVNGRAGWVNDMVLVAKYLKELKNKHPDNIEFGKTLDEAGVDISKNDRAALLGFADNLTHMKKVFEEIFPDRTSIQTMWNARETQALYGKKKRAYIRAATSTAPQKEEEDEEKDNVVQMPERSAPKTDWKKSDKPLGDTGFRKVKEEEPQEKVAALEETLEPSAKEKLETVKRQYARKLEAELKQKERILRASIEEEVTRRYKKAVDEMFPRLKEREERAERIIKSRPGGVFTREEFRKIQSWLHPDRVTDPEQKKELTAIFTLFNDRKALLCNEKELPMGSSSSSMPKTSQEWNARKTEMNAKEAERKARKAERDKRYRAAKKQQAAAAATG